MAGMGERQPPSGRLPVSPEPRLDCRLARQPIILPTGSAAERLWRVGELFGRNRHSQEAGQEPSTGRPKRAGVGGGTADGGLGLKAWRCTRFPAPMIGHRPPVPVLRALSNRTRGIVGDRLRRPRERRRADTFAEPLAMLGRRLAVISLPSPEFDQPAAEASAYAWDQFNGDERR